MNTSIKDAVRVGLGLATLERAQSEQIGRECAQLVTRFSLSSKEVCRSFQPPLLCPLTIRHRHTQLAGHRLEWFRTLVDLNGWNGTEPVFLRRNSTEYSADRLEKGLRGPLQPLVNATEISAQRLRVENIALVQLRMCIRSLLRPAAVQPMVELLPSSNRISAQAILHSIRQGMDLRSEGAEPR
jgi:hypothetical protein